MEFFFVHFLRFFCARKGPIWTRDESKKALKEIQETAARKKARNLQKKLAVERLKGVSRVGFYAHFDARMFSVTRKSKNCAPVTLILQRKLKS